MLRDLLTDVRFRLRALFRRDDVERELAEELQGHLDVETDRVGSDRSSCSGFDSTPYFRDSHARTIDCP